MGAFKLRQQAVTPNCPTLFDALLDWSPAAWDDAADCLRPAAARRHSVACTRTFGRPQTDAGALAEAVATFAARAAEKLRRHGLAAHLLTVVLGTDKFGPVAGPATHTAVLKLAPAAQDDGALTRAALRGLHQLHRPGVAYHCAGVLLSGLEPVGQAQLGLFAGSAADQQRGRQLMATLDALNGRFGRQVVRLAAAGVRHAPAGSAREPAWAAHRSPRYTTAWDELWQLR